MLKFFSEELLLVGAGYEKDSIVAEYTVPGTYTLDLKSTGIYEIEAVSGGAGGQTSWWFDAWYLSAAGGTGCYYKNTFSISKGTYTVIVGAGGAASGSMGLNGGGATTFGDILVLEGASYGYWQSTGPKNAWIENNYGGYLVSEASTVGTKTYAAGNVAYGGASNAGYTFGTNYGPQSSYGLGNYGKGGYSVAATSLENGTGGYLKITYKRRT